MNALDLVLRWLHIIPAVILVGGLFFQRLVLVPALAARDDKQELWQATTRPWARVVMVCTLLLLAIGIINAVRNITGDPAPGGIYHVLVGVKLLLALAIMALAALLSGRSPAAEKVRQNMAMWLNIALLLAVVLIGAAGVMKLTPRVPKEVETSSNAAGRPAMSIVQPRQHDFSTLFPASITSLDPDTPIS